MTRRLLAVLLGGVVCLSGPSLHATLVIPAEFREIVADAVLIVRGTVTDVRSFVVSGSQIDSVATVAVEALLKGEADRFVPVRVPGGEIGRTRYVMTGAPVFRTGQRAVFFLKRGADAGWRIVGLTQGLYRVQIEPGTGRAVMQVPIVPGRTADATGPIARGDPRRRPIPISEFESLVRLVMANPGGQAVPRGRR
jgi:hypothetical protein